MLEPIGWIVAHRRTGHAPARLAAFSLSRWLSHQFGPGFAAWRTANTEHLACGKKLPCLAWSRRRKFSMDAKAEKMALLRYGHAPLVFETLARGEFMPRAQRSPIGTTRSLAPNGLRFPSIACCTGPGVIAGWFRSLGSLPSAGLWNLSRYYPAAGRVDRALEARKTVSYGYYVAAGISARFGLRLLLPRSGYVVSLPQTAPPQRTTIARRARSQEVSGRV